MLNQLVAGARRRDDHMLFPLEKVLRQALRDARVDG